MMIDLDITQKLYFEAENWCGEQRSNEAWLFERKFTELIIKECCDAALNVVAVPDWYRDSVTIIPQHCSDSIKKHFGVK